LLLEPDMGTDSNTAIGEFFQAWAIYQLDPQEITAACGHIQNHDQPETAETLIELAKNAGFARIRPVCAWTWHQALLFSA